jgi:26S proteasome regulatory subunit N5
MSDNKKQERDFTPEVDSILPEAASLAKVVIPNLPIPVF